MTVTAPNADVLNVFVLVPVESPVEAIDLVAEQLDIPSGAPAGMLDRDTVLNHLYTLRRGYGNALPVQFAVIEVLALSDEKFQLGTDEFADMLWESWRLASEEEPSDEELAMIDELAA